MPLASFLTILAGAFVSSILSATLGIVGGSALLLILSFEFSFAEAMFLHGFIQFISALMRSAFNWKHIQWRLVLNYSLGMILPTAAYAFAAHNLDRQESYILVGLILIVSMNIPMDKILAQLSKGKIMLVTGTTAGILGPIIGVTGTITAPVFLKLKLGKAGYIGNKAACQVLVHIAKMGIYGSLIMTESFQSSQWSLLAVLILLVVFVANWLGKLILSKIEINTYIKMVSYLIYVMAALFILRGLS